MKMLRILPVAVCVLALSLSSAFGQAKMAGQVIDATGNPVAGAKVRLAPSDSRGRANSVTCGSDGVYRFSFVPPAKYRVFVEAEGLAMVEVQGTATTRSGQEGWNLDLRIDPEAPPELEIASGHDVVYNVVLDDAERAKLMSKVSTSVEEITSLVQKGDCAAALPKTAAYLEAVPEAARVHYLQGFCLASGGEIDKAGDSIGRALELEPGMNGAALLMGQALLGAGKFDGAVEWLRREIDEGSNQSLKAGAWTALGHAYRDSGQEDPAFDAFSKATEIDDANDVAWIERARIERNRKNLSAAEDALAEAIELGDEGIGLLLNLGIDYYNEKSYGDVERVCQEVLASAEKRSQSAMAYALIARSKLAGTPGDAQKQQAEAALRKSLELDPNGQFSAENQEMLKKLKG
ncbi:hypothetical protein ABI59_01870 [Acidobacteria bacterium Mor1]|nr:hypothetical protein ABI59_01870 [Acidobacteria bacterium Mor1]